MVGRKTLIISKLLAVMIPKARANNIFSGANVMDIMSLCIYFVRKKIYIGWDVLVDILTDFGRGLCYTFFFLRLIFLLIENKSIFDFLLQIYILFMKP